MDRPAAAKGFEVVFPPEGVEKGFEKGFEPAANGFPDIDGLAPNRLSPRLTAGFVGSGFGSSFLVSFGFGLLADSAIRVPLNARILPSFLRHVFRRHVRIYRRRS